MSRVIETQDLALGAFCVCAGKHRRNRQPPLVTFVSAQHPVIAIATVAFDAPRRAGSWLGEAKGLTISCRNWKDFSLLVGTVKKQSSHADGVKADGDGNGGIEEILQSS